MAAPRLGCRLVLDAPEGCVNVRVKRLEPVTKRPPEHTSSGARRAAFYDIVLAIKEIRRIAGIVRQGHKAWKGLEFRACPFPSVSNDVLHAESAGAPRIPAHGSRIPIRKIEIPKTRIRGFIAPRIVAFHAFVRRSVCCAVELRFGR